MTEKLENLKKLKEQLTETLKNITIQTDELEYEEIYREGSFAWLGDIF